MRSVVQRSPDRAGRCATSVGTAPEDGDARAATRLHRAPARDRPHDALHVRDAPSRAQATAAESRRLRSGWDLVLTRQRGDADQVSLLTVRTSRGRRARCGGRDPGPGRGWCRGRRGRVGAQDRSGRRPVRSMRGAPESVVPHLGAAAWEYVCQEAPQKLHAGDRDAPHHLRPVVPIPKRDVLIRHRLQSAVRDRDAGRCSIAHGDAHVSAAATQRARVSNRRHLLLPSSSERRVTASEAAYPLNCYQKLLDEMPDRHP